MKKSRADIPSAFSLFFIFFVLPLNIFAANLSEYREKIRTSAKLTDNLYRTGGKVFSSAAERSRYERETIEKLRKTLPVSEKVEWQGTSIETNNQWLKDRLNEYEAESDPGKRRTILSGIREQLWSIGLKIDELEILPLKPHKGRRQAKARRNFKSRGIPKTRNTRKKLA